MVLDAVIVPAYVHYPVKSHFSVVFHHSAASEQSQQCGWVFVILWDNFIVILNLLIYLMFQIYTSHNFAMMNVMVVF